ncbi:MAG: winged helix-turn-helix transcriptional regulator [Actinobacteria bacterium]|nr:winged helix-turn-helix transcriptional regulator [Actinomycetota bacterium]
MSNRTTPTTGSLVWHLATRWRTVADRTVAEWGLTHATYSALACLRALTTDRDLPNQRELANYAGLDPVYTSKLVRVLERDGLLVRRPDPSDARSVLLEITEDGATVADRAMARMRRLDQDLTASIGGPSSEAVSALNRTLSTLLAQTEPARHTTNGDPR